MGKFICNYPNSHKVSTGDLLLKKFVIFHKYLEEWISIRDHANFNFLSMLNNMHTKVSNFLKRLKSFVLNLISAEPKISPETFSKAFPFHLLFDRDLVIRQAGTAISRVMPEVLENCRLTDIVEMVWKLEIKNRRKTWINISLCPLRCDPTWILPLTTFSLTSTQFTYYELQTPSLLGSLWPLRFWLPTIPWWDSRYY